MKNLKTILLFLSPHWKFALLAPFLVLVEVIADLLQPEYMSKIVNEGVIGGNMGVILPIGMRMISIVAAGLICGILSIVVAGYVSYHFGAEMRNRLFQQINLFSFEEMDNFQPGSLITRLTADVTKVQHVIQSSMRLLFRSPFLFVGAVIMIFTINNNVASILLVLLPMLLFWITFILKRSYPLFVKVQLKADRLNTIIQENLAGARVIKAYVREKGEEKRFREANQDLTDVSLDTIKYTSLLMPVLSLFINLGIVLVVWIGGIKVNIGAMEVGDILACTNYLAQILTSLMMASKVIMSITEAQASLNRINEVLNTGSAKEQSPTAENTLCPLSVSAEHVYFKYGEGTANNTADDDDDATADNHILKDISFNVKPGESLAIIGGTGSGKSTLVHLMAGFYKVEKGSIKIGGKDINAIEKTRLRKLLGTIFQKTTLFAGTIRENICWGKADATDEEVIEACKMAQIHDFITSLPGGYNHYIEQGASNLSGGQKQRLSIARSLIARSPIIILDDCFSALDFSTEAKLRSALKKLPATKIVIAQRIGSIKWADKILLLDDGEVKGYGTHNELIQDNVIYKELYNSQVS